MKKNFLKWTMLAIVAATLFTACKKDKPGEGNDEELITTMNLKFTPVGGGSVLSFTYDDPDGPGGIAPTQSVIALNSGVTYNVEVELLNKTANPVENITTEVAAESDAHRFYYQTTGAAPVVSNLNNDSDGKPLGITSTWTAGAAGAGTAKVTLRHYAGTPPGKETADPVNSPKSATDIEVTFITSVQ